MRKPIIALVILALMLTNGCIQPQAKVRGTIARISMLGDGTVVSIHLEGDIEGIDTDKLTVHVNEKTKVYGGGKTVGRNAIRGDETVEVLFSGAVMESYPQQIHAYAIKILNYHPRTP
jgi:preprotein translocase subunit YajC